MALGSGASPFPGRLVEPSARAPAGGAPPCKAPPGDAPPGDAPPGCGLTLVNNVHQAESPITDDDLASAHDDGSLPSYAPSAIDIGDVDAYATGAEILIRPEGPHDMMVDGCWGTPGQKSEGSEGGRVGTFGVLCGNWGGRWEDEERNDHVRVDLKSSPCNILLVQEVQKPLFEYLKSPGKTGVNSTRGSGETWARRPQSQWIGFRGPEQKVSLMTVGREGLVKGARLLFFRLRHDGVFTKKTKGKNCTRKEYKAVSRIMVVEFQMRFWCLHGSGGEEEGLVTINIHLHNMTAKKEIRDGSRSLKAFFDEVATYIIQFRARLLGGDFNMALWMVVPELRARGIQVNLAAWYPWQHATEVDVRSDSCGLFIIGPTVGIRKIYDCSLFKIEPPEIPSTWKPVPQIRKDDTGKEVDRQPWPVRVFNMIGSGFALTSYRPDVPARREEYVHWSFAPGIDPSSSAVADILERAQRDRATFPFPINTKIGEASWNWPAMPVSRQKLVDDNKFDPRAQMFKGGAHMPLMIFLGSSSAGRRTPAAQMRREERAERRGWGKERRASASRGGGQAAGQQTNHWRHAGSSSTRDDVETITWSTRGGEIWTWQASWDRPAWSTRGGRQQLSSSSQGWDGTRGGRQCEWVDVVTSWRL